MPVRAVVFDLFDTLVDLSMDGLPQVQVGERRFASTIGALHELVQQHARIPIEALADAIGAVDREERAPRAEAGRELPTLERMQLLAARLGIRDPGLPARLTATHMGLFRSQVTPLPHHAEVVAKLKERGLRVAVCSNFSHTQTALRVLEESGLRWLFDSIIVSDAVAWRKPRPEIFRTTLAALDVAPEEALHVGDSLKADVCGAAALGIRTAWVTRRIAVPEDALAAHEGPAPDHVVADLEEVLGLVGRPRVD